VQIVGEVAYVADQGYAGDLQPKSGLQIIDIHDPDQPRLLATSPFNEGSGAAHVVGATAYLTSAPERGLVVVDLSDPTHPIPRGNADMPRTASAIFHAGDVTYVIGFGELYAFDTRNPDQPTEIGTYRIMQASDILVTDTLAYVTIYNQGLQILEVGNPAQITLRGTYTAPKRN
jgi:hypothetical protein